MVIMAETMAVLGKPIEVDQSFGLRKAMSSAKQSFTEDIQSGFQALHVDTSVILLIVV